MWKQRRIASSLLTAAITGVSCNHSTSPVHGIRERWYRPQTGFSFARPTTAGDVVYFGTGDGAVVARDINTGQARWTSRLGSDPIEGANLLVRSGVLVVPAVRQTFGVDTATGRVLWQYSAPLDTVGAGASAAPGQVVASRIDADDQSVFIPAWGASVSAVALSNGAVSWVWRPGPAAGDTAAAGVFRSGSNGVRVSGDTVLATVWHFLDAKGLTSEAWLVMLDRHTGHELSRVVLPSYTGGVVVQGAPALFGNYALVATRGGHAFAIDRWSGQTIWHYTPNTQHATDAQVEVLGETAYLDGGDGSVYALQASTGTVLWRSVVEAELSRDLLVTTDRVIAVSGAYLFVIDRADGRMLASTTQPHTADPLFSSPPAAANSHFFVSANGAAWSFDVP